MNSTGSFPSAPFFLLFAVFSGFILSSFLPNEEVLGLPQFQDAPASFWRGEPFHGLERNAEAVFEDHLKPRTAASKELARELIAECNRHHLDPAFVLSVIQVESGFRMRTVSSAGAIGLLQLMPSTARHLARKLRMKPPTQEDLKDPSLNLKLGIAYLAELRNRYEGLSLYFVLAAYNMGPARLDALRSKPGFKPDRTLKYYENVIGGMDHWRSYSSIRTAELARRMLMGGSRGKISQVVEKRGRSI